MSLFRGSYAVLACLLVGPWGVGLNANSPALGGGLGSVTPLFATLSVRLPEQPFFQVASPTSGKDYLAAGAPRRVVFAAPAVEDGPMDDAAVFDAESSHSFSAFMARIAPPASEPELEPAESQQGEGSSPAATPQAPVSVSPVEQAEAAGAELRLEVRSPQVQEVRQQGALFARPEANRYSESRMFLFFPLDESAARTSEAGADLNVNILTPVNRFDYFTPPMRPSPQSSAVYRTEP